MMQLRKFAKITLPVKRWNIKRKRKQRFCHASLSCFASVIFGVFVISIGSLSVSSSYIHKYLADRRKSPYIVNNKQEGNRFVNMSGIIQKTHSTFQGKINQILFINKPRWINIEKGNEYITNRCHFKNCVMTNIVRNISQISAIVFSAQNSLAYNSSYLNKKRPNSQVWIFLRMEPPEERILSWYRDPAWQNKMNWSWGYRLDSDIFRPVQVLTKRNTLPQRDYEAIFKRKRKLAIWVVSHCHAKSLRDEYVNQLILEGVHVDIFGKCSTNKSRISRNAIYKTINEDYKFYLSFENNFCKDYVTEKFFTYFGLDTVLVVRGGLNYSEHFDSNAFIDASSFSTVKSLARYMLRVSQDITLYTRYLRNKDKYDNADPPGNSLIQSECILCERINSQDQYKKNYEDIATYIHNGTCFNPYEIV